MEISKRVNQTTEFERVIGETRFRFVHDVFYNGNSKTASTKVYRWIAPNAEYLFGEWELEKVIRHS